MEARHSKDCMACRIASGSGIIGLGIYLFVQSRKLLRKPVQRGIIGTMAAGTVGLGIARLFDLLPKEDLTEREKKQTVAKA